MELLRILVTPRAGEAIEVMDETGLLLLLLGGVVRRVRFERLCEIEAALNLQPDADLPARGAWHFREGGCRPSREKLRLTSQEAKDLEGLSAVSPAISPCDGTAVLEVLLYKLGARLYLGRLLLAWATDGAAPGRRGLAIRRGSRRHVAAAHFPLGGADLIALGLQPGPALGAILKDLEAEWMRSGFTADRETLCAWEGRERHEVQGLRALLDCSGAARKPGGPGSQSLARSTSATTRFGCAGIGCTRRQPHDEIAALVESLRERGIRRIYPFLGPMDAEGWPGWRSKAGHVRYVPERAGAFLAEIHRIAPEIRVIPWTGGNLDSDVHLNDAAQRQAFAEHARRLVALGADGVQLNMEPLPSGTAAYLDAAARSQSRHRKPHAVGGGLSAAQRTRNRTAIPIGSCPLCAKSAGIANELAVMAYDTGIASAPDYEALVSTWTRQLAAALPAPSSRRLRVAHGRLRPTTTTRTITGRMWRRSSIASKGSWRASGDRPGTGFPRRGDLRFIYRR